MTPPVRFRVPTTEVVHAALARLGSLQAQRAFYGKLLNPLWVAELAKVDAFSSPPEVVASADGALRASPWPQGEYLARMADQVPTDVARIFLGIVGTQNPWVRRSIAEGTARLPAADAVGLVDALCRWVGDGPTNLVDPQAISGIIVNLLVGGQTSGGMKLARAYYRPRRARSEPVFGVPEPQVGIEDYMYEQTLPSVVRAMGDGRLHELIYWLQDYQRFAKSYEEESATDSSYIWRPSIARGSGTQHEVGDALVDAVREAVLEQFAIEPTAVTNRLMHSKHQLIRRIALDVCAEVIEGNRDDQPRPDQSTLADVASQLLGDPAHGDIALRVEYVRLIRACLGQPEVYSLAPVEELVRSGPQLDADRLFAIYQQRNPDDSDDELRQHVEDYLARWRHKLLAGVGRAGLTAPMQELLDQLDQRFGPIESPAAPAWQVGGFVGEQSALSEAEMVSMSDDAVLEHLLAWEPEPRPGIGMTYEMTGRVLASVIASSPERFVETGLARIQALRPTYIRSVLSGWREAVRAGNVVPWDVALDLAAWVTAKAETEQANDPRTLDGDRTLLNARMEVARLLVEAMSPDPTGDESRLTENQREDAARILLSLASRRDDGPQAGDSGMDPLTASLNYVRPESVRGLVQLTRWQTSAETRRRMLDYLLAGATEDDPELAIAAVLGEGIGRLYESARDWLTEHTTAIFGGAGPSTPFQQTALSTALATHNPHPALVAQLRPSLLTAMSEFDGPPPAMGWADRRPFAQLVGNWIVTEYVTGRLTDDDPLFSRFFVEASPTDRGEVVGHIAWSMMHAEQVSDDVLRRTRNLWEQRMRHVADHPADAAELGDFHWFIRSHKFEASWWLPQLVAVVSAYPQFNPRGMIGEDIAEAALQDPARAFVALAGMVGNLGADEQMTRYDLMEHAVPQVIAAALDSRDTTLRDAATKLMNDLGQRGYIDLAERVLQVRRP